MPSHQADDSSVPPGVPGQSEKRAAREQERRLVGLAGGILAAVASQATILSAILFYFGWAKERATWAYFGVDDLGVLNFSFADYLLRSVSTDLPLLMAVGFLVIGALVLHIQVREMLAGNDKLRHRLALLANMTGGFLSAIGFALALSLTGSGGSKPVGPGILVVGLLLLSYAPALRGKKSGGDSWLVLTVLTVALIAFLWTVTGYADYVGSENARELQNGLPRAANVIVYSSADLSLAGPGIGESRSMAPGVRYPYRYTGLRLLVSSGGQDFLVPSGWHPGRGSVIVLPAVSGSIRLEFQEPTP